jgi:hypothetical protein
MNGSISTYTEGLSNRNVHGLILVLYQQPTSIEINRRVIYVTVLSPATKREVGP